MNYIGMDIHKQFTVAVVKDKDGNKLAEEKFENSKCNFENTFKDFLPEETKIVMESTSVWEYIYDILEEMKYTVILANPVKTRAIAEARIKTDSIDANTLCDLLRANLIAECYIPPKEIRNLRNIMRQRKSIVHNRVQMVNKIHAVLLMNGIKLPYAKFGKASMEWIIEEIKITTVKTILVSFINILEQIDFELKKIDERIRDIAVKNPKALLLMTIPGIAEIRAMEILAEIGDINRFESSEKLCSYVGLTPGVKQSGTTIRYGRLIKQANRNLKYVFVEAAISFLKVKKDNTLKQFYQKLSKKKGKQKAKCALARKICSITYAMLKKNQEFMLL